MLTEILLPQDTRHSILVRQLSVVRRRPVQIDDMSPVAQVYLGPSLIGDIWGLLQQTLNFSYSMVEVVRLTKPDCSIQINSVDNNFGALQPDGTYDGVVSPGPFPAYLHLTFHLRLGWFTGMRSTLVLRTSTPTRRGLRWWTCPPSLITRGSTSPNTFPCLEKLFLGTFSS